MNSSEQPGRSQYAGKDACPQGGKDPAADANPQAATSKGDLPMTYSADFIPNALYVFDSLRESAPTAYVSGPFETYAAAESDRAARNCADDYVIVRCTPSGSVDTPHGPRNCGRGFHFIEAVGEVD